ncbi:uncharacterized protein LOC122375482 [Amphibalanus amphitrite]|uniref:uncharacterized protein LOC122375482 n=1 Tax=Amphibalanus amphitrite TaxID=1232801 RepID=UPI001C929652|nr:uncharacterized protein LOC122375482 [Amphibalanus amphitrite]
MKDKLAPWIGRGLTPYGRVHLLKTELISQLVYVMTVLPAPPKPFIKEVEKLMFKFIWGGKKDKVKRMTLKSKYKGGGLKVPDLALQAQSLKVTWKGLVTPMLFLNDDITLFHCNTNAKYIKNTVKNTFWEETCIAWNNINGANLSATDQLQNSILWANKDLNIESNANINRKHLIEKGIIRLADICNLRKKELMTVNEISQKFGVHPMVSAAIKNAVPTAWSNKIRNLQRSVNATSIEQLQNSSKPARWAYSKLLEQVLDTTRGEKSHTKWEAELEGGRRLNWPAIYARLHYAVEDVNLKWLNYRCIKRILPTNKLLFTCNIKDTDRCTYCHQVETIGHLFWHCHRVRAFWSSIGELFNGRNITYKVVVTGFEHNDSAVCKRINTILSLGKQFIWYKRECNSHLSEPTFVTYLYNYLKVERYAYKINDRETKFNDTWGSLFCALAERVER